MSANDYGRQRHLLAQAQQVTSEIRSAPLDVDSVRASFPKLVELCRIVKRFIDSTVSLPEDGTRAMWEQRGTWLQEEVAALAQERIYSPDQQQHWLNLVLLMFAGADACDRALRDKVAAEMSLQAGAEKCGRLEVQLRQLEGQVKELEGQQRLPAHAAEEALQLRSKAVVLEQELERHQRQTQALSEQVQLLVAERDTARRRADELQAENETLMRQSEGRMEVIRTMMVKAEGSSTQSSTLAVDNAQLQGHCKTLSVNLETNAQVIEQLIELNTELMDSLNSATAAVARQQQAAGTDLGAGLASSWSAGGGVRMPPPSFNGVPQTLGPSNGVSPPPPAYSPPLSSSLPQGSPQGGLAAGSGRSRDGHVIPVSVHGGQPPPPLRLPAPVPLSSKTPHYAAAAAAPAPFATRQGLDPLPQRPPHPPAAPAAGPATSFSAAFEAFLNEPEAGVTSVQRKAQAETFALPPLASTGQLPVGSATAAAGGAPGRRGVGRLVGGLFKYVAGTDAAPQS